MAKFARKGKSKVYFVPTIAAVSGSSPGSPTGPEISAGTDLSPQLQAIAGFDLNNTPIPAENLADAFTATIPGEDQVNNPTLTFHDDDAVTGIRTALAKGTSGYIVRMPYGNVTAKRCEIYKVTVTGNNDLYAVGNETAKFQVGFSVASPPNQAGVLP
jgi:hypothetical protein